MSEKVQHHIYLSQAELFWKMFYTYTYLYIPTCVFLNRCVTNFKEDVKQCFCKMTDHGSFALQEQLWLCLLQPCCVALWILH